MVGRCGFKDTKLSCICCRWDILPLSKSWKGNKYRSSWGLKQKSMGFRSKVRFFVPDEAAKLTQLLRWWTSRLSTRSILTSSVSTTLPWCFCRTALTSWMNLPVCWRKSFLWHLHTWTPSKVNLGHTGHVHLNLLDKTLALANSFGGSLDIILYMTSYSNDIYHIHGLAWSLKVSTICIYQEQSPRSKRKEERGWSWTYHRKVFKPNSWHSELMDCIFTTSIIACSCFLAY
jgi:hypothetical protein